MASLPGFIKDTIVSPRGLPDPSRSVEERVQDLDDRMQLLDVLTWTVVPAAVVVGLRSFRQLARADRHTPVSRIASDAVVCTGALVATSMAKLWHANAQEHTETMKELILLGESGPDAPR